MNFKPLGPNVLVKLDNELDRKHGVLHLPQTAQDQQPVEATVVEIGTGRYTAAGVSIPFGVDKGDKVLVPPKAGAPINVNGEEHRVMSVGDVLGIVS
jgi:chaperonin GroES